MIDPEELTTAHLPKELRRGESDERACSESERMAIYALVYRRRARAASTRAAVGVTLSCLLAALFAGSPWVAAAGFAACPVVYVVAYRNAQRMLRARLNMSQAALSACVDRFMASSEGAATAAMLERGDAQVNLRAARRERGVS